MKNFTHFDAKGRAVMVDISAKKITSRTAQAQAEIFMKKETLEKIAHNSIQKGDTFTVAKIAGIMGAKNTATIIPLCHQLSLSDVDISFTIDDQRNCVVIKSEVKVEGKTGAEMEALTAALISAVTIYDMCKAVDKDMVISNVCLLKKTGGRSGIYIKKDV